jgi:hypothetical protein
MRITVITEDDLEVIIYRVDSSEYAQALPLIVGKYSRGEKLHIFRKPLSFVMQQVVNSILGEYKS